MSIKNILSKTLNISHLSLQSLASRAPRMYKVYSIPKRKSGKRIIAHPAKELKIIQRELSKHLSEKFPIHNSAFAYRVGLSIRDNAEKHRKSRYLLKMDFADFFNSITPKLLNIKLKSHVNELTSEDVSMITNLIFWNPSKKKNGKLVLSVGAPTSPLISNFIMYDFDEKISNICTEYNIIYTRYADDITFSTNIKGALFSIPEQVEQLLSKELHGDITINHSKTVFSSMAHNRHVTGVTITNEKTLSIGRQRKRYISSLIHQFSLGKLSDQDLKHLKGLLSYAYSIEPLFIKRMTLKYGEFITSQLIKMGH